MNNKKKAIVLFVVGVTTMFLVIVGATYAYFTAQGGLGANADINTQTYTTDNLSFQVGNAISLTASEEDFGSGMSNKSGSTYARATLTANNATNNATRNYYLYLDIESNDFLYTTVDKEAEILLKVTNPDGIELTSINGLVKKSSGSGENEVTGFDITTKKGLITIANNYEIVSIGTRVQEWNIEVIFVNLDSNQNINTEKTFKANLLIQEESISASQIITGLYTSNGENNLY